MLTHRGLAGRGDDGLGQAVGLAKALGSPLRAPYMTAGFMALLVIPALKLSDRGLFDGQKFEFVPAVEC